MFGVVFLEALACGVPVIGSKVDGSREALSDGQNERRKYPARAARVKVYEIEPTFDPLPNNDSTNEIARDDEENVNSDESRSERKQAGVEKYHARDSDCSQPVNVWAKLDCKREQADTAPISFNLVCPTAFVTLPFGAAPEA